MASLCVAFLLPCGQAGSIPSVFAAFVPASKGIEVPVEKAELVVGER